MSQPPEKRPLPARLRELQIRDSSTCSLFHLFSFFLYVFPLSHQKKKEDSCCKVSFPPLRVPKEAGVKLRSVTSPCEVRKRSREENSCHGNGRFEEAVAETKTEPVSAQTGDAGTEYWRTMISLQFLEKIHILKVLNPQRNTQLWPCSGETQSRNSCAGMLALYLYLLCLSTMWCLLCGCSFWSLTCRSVAEPACIVFPAWRTGTGGSTGDRHTNAPYLSWNHTPVFFFSFFRLKRSQELHSELF